MDNENYEQIEIEEVIIGDQKFFLTDGMEVTINLYENKVLSISYLKHEVEVLEADAVIKGQTVSSSFKPAIVTTMLK